MKWLLIGDPHAHPEYDNDRFEWLGKYIVDEEPDIILCIGDFADMPSLSSYDVGKKTFEGRRYTSDVEAAVDAQKRMFIPIHALQEQQRTNKKRIYKPLMVMTLGNHEDRINRAVNSDSKLDGVLSINDLGYKQFGWHVVPFNETIELLGWNFSHYFATGVSGRPISGENIAKSLLMKNFTSSVQGHSHVLDYAQRTTADGNKLHGMSIGCYSHPEQVEGWNANTVRMWWYGVVGMETDNEGNLQTLEFKTQDALREKYNA